MTASYDAILIVSFGGPEGPNDVMPFLENVTRGRNVPRERLLEVSHHYDLYGGVSPINGQNRRIVAALKEELKKHGPDLPVYWGNRNWHPFLVDTLKQMRDDGVKRALAFVTSAYSSYSSCRQYLDDIHRAQEQLGADAPVVDKVRPFFNHPLFIEANSEHLQKTLQNVPAKRLSKAHVAFTAHSIPMGMAGGCDYAAQLTEACRLVAANCSVENWQLVYQSRSGPPTVPWLEPDILEHIRSVNEKGVRDLVILPIGFVSDHMEVVYDLDHEAQSLCQQLGIKMLRATTASTNPKFIQMIRVLIEERINNGAARDVVGEMPVLPDTCPPECCPLGAARPAMSGAAQEQKKH